jgi:hypothetical protein
MLVVLCAYMHDADGVACDYVASASSVLTFNSNVRMAFMAFDSTMISFYASQIPPYSITTGIATASAAVTVVQSVGNVVGEWLQITLPAAYTVTSYQVAPRSDQAIFFRSRSASTWKVVGSNDGINW